MRQIAQLKSRFFAQISSQAQTRLILRCAPLTLCVSYGVFFVFLRGLCGRPLPFRSLISVYPRKSAVKRVLVAALRSLRTPR
jgi:hypothetical protein